MVIFFIPFFHPSMHSMGKSWRVADQNLWQIFSSLFASCDGIIQHTTLWKHYQDDSASQSVESGKVLFTLVKHPHLKLGRFIFVLVLYLCRYRFFFCFSVSFVHISITFTQFCSVHTCYYYTIYFKQATNMFAICLFYTCGGTNLCFVTVGAVGVVAVLPFHVMTWHGMVYHVIGFHWF